METIHGKVCVDSIHKKDDSDDSVDSSVEEVSRRFMEMIHGDDSRKSPCRKLELFWRANEPE